MPASNFVFVCGSDDYLVNCLGAERFETAAADLSDEFSREILSGFANNVGEVEEAVNRFRESVQTLGLFGGRKAVWLKDVNFLADSVTGRAEGTLRQVEALQEILTAINPEEVAIVITATPVDRRRAFIKWCQKHSEFVSVTDPGRGEPSAVIRVAGEEARRLRIELTVGASELLADRLNGNTRLAAEEVRKLSCALDEGADRIEEKLVAELTPAFGEGDFFEAAEAFFSGDLRWTLDALRRHFFAGNDARPVLAALQNRNRLLIQVRALVDSGELRIGSRGLDKGAVERAGVARREMFGGSTEKTPFSMFTQNVWYLGKLATSGRLPSLRRLIDNQLAFTDAFAELIERPDDQEGVMRELAIRRLSESPRS